MSPIEEAQTPIIHEVDGIYLLWIYIQKASETYQKNSKFIWQDAFKKVNEVKPPFNEKMKELILLEKI